MEAISEFLLNNITSFVTQHGVLSVFVLMLLESALIPIPSEVTMPFAGFLASSGKLSFWLVVFVGALGNLIGSQLAWYIGTKGEGFTRRWIRNWGKWVLISEHELDISISFYKRFGQPITFFSRLMPVVRTYISLPAGIAKMPLLPFSVLTFIGSFLWSAFLTWLGLKLGENWHSLSFYFRNFDYLIVGAAAALVALYIFYKIRKK